MLLRITLLTAFLAASNIWGSGFLLWLFPLMIGIHVAYRIRTGHWMDH